MDRYIIISAEGVALNTVVWDGVSDWSPPSGCTVAREDSPEGQDAIAKAAAQAPSDETE